MIKKQKQTQTTFVFFDILYKISRGDTRLDIATSYGWSPNRLDYYIRKLKTQNLIGVKTRSNIVVYALTEEGKKTLTQYVNQAPSQIRLHNVAFTYPIVEGGTLQPDKEWHLKGTIQKLKKESNASIVWNHKSLTIHLQSLFGNDAYALENEARTLADTIVRMLGEQYGFVLGDPQLSRKPHYAIVNPLIDKISQHTQISNDIAKIDESEGSGEIEYFDPKKVDQFIRMPETVNNLYTVVEKSLIPLIEKNTYVMNEFSKQIELHLSVQKQQSENQTEMNKMLKSLQKVLEDK